MWQAYNKMLRVHLVVLVAALAVSAECSASNAPSAASARVAISRNVDAARASCVFSAGSKEKRYQ